MRVIVCGSRTWKNDKVICRRLLDLPRGTIIVHGNAKGADQIAASVAYRIGLKVESHPANWDEHHRAAGPIRNKLMASLGADLCIAFWDGKSKGTKNMIETARKHDIHVDIITAGDSE
jgi:hypothetical protein